VFIAESMQYLKIRIIVLVCYTYTGFADTYKNKQYLTVVKEGTRLVKLQGISKAR
jgi:hypothetical protein